MFTKHGEDKQQQWQHSLSPPGPLYSPLLLLITVHRKSDTKFFRQLIDFYPPDNCLPSPIASSPFVLPLLQFGFLKKILIFVFLVDLDSFIPLINFFIVCIFPNSIVIVFFSPGPSLKKMKPPLKMYEGGEDAQKLQLASSLLSLWLLIQFRFFAFFSDVWFDSSILIFFRSEFCASFQSFLIWVCASSTWICGVFVFLRCLLFFLFFLVMPILIPFQFLTKHLSFGIKAQPQSPRF